MAAMTSHAVYVRLATTFVSKLSRHLLRDVETNLSTFQEQHKCRDDVETKFKWIETRLDMSQHLATLLRWARHRLSTNVEGMLRQML